MAGWIYLLILALTTGAAVGIIVRLTVSLIKQFRKRRHTQVIAAQMSTIAREAAKNPRVKHVSFDDLDKYDSAVLEYDPYSDEVVQTTLCEDVDDVVRRHQQQGGGIVIYEDQ